MPSKKIPRATARRLPIYYRYLTVLLSANKKRVSSTELSEAVQVDSATIRRDFSYFGELGKRGYGYDVANLLKFFKGILHQDSWSAWPWLVSGVWGVPCSTTTSTRIPTCGSARPLIPSPSLPTLSRVGSRFTQPRR